MRIEGRFVATGARYGETVTNCDLTCASIEMIVVMVHHRKSFAPTVVKSGEIGGNCATTTASCDKIDGTYAETGAISGVTGVMSVVKLRGRKGSN